MMQAEMYNAFLAVGAPESTARSAADSITKTIVDFIKEYPKSEELTTRTILDRELKNLGLLKRAELNTELKGLGLLKKVELDAELRDRGLVTKSDLTIELQALELRMIKWLVGVAIPTALLVIAGTTMAVKIF